MCARPSRRRLLRTLGLAAVGGLAGCSGGGQERTPTAHTDTPAGPRRSVDLPPYATFVPDTTDAVLVTMSDRRVDSGHQVGSPPETVRDPLRYASMTAAYVGALLELSVYGTDFGFERGRLDVSGLRRALTVDTVGVLELPVDLSGAIADAKDGAGTVRFEGEGRAVIANADGAVAGLTTDAVVFTPPRLDTESPDRIREIVDTRAGARRPKHEADDGFASLVAEADATGSLACGYAPDSAVETLARGRAASSPVSLPTDGFGSATGAVFRIYLDNGEPPQPASAVMRFSDGATPDSSATASVGSAATDRAVSRDGETVRITGTYGWDALGEFEGSLLDGL
ncbi:hypothetical protein [Haloarcula laminariae]|uniref:hypothetical protein n=1 Tax=Haloarcula laminariae TaxID=2961577 RepID=UPI0024067CFD|nr:hypothetical protein [Halomicroarcula sp. FL173]